MRIPLSRLLEVYLYALGVTRVPCVETARLCRPRCRPRFTDPSFVLYATYSTQAAPSLDACTLLTASVFFTEASGQALEALELKA